MKWRICFLFSSFFLNFHNLYGIFANQDVLLYEGCDVGSEPCKLRCFFNVTTENFNVTWTSNGVAVDSSSVKNFPTHSVYLSKLTLRKNFNSEGNYTCIGHDYETGQTMAHSFPIYGNQSLPKILNSSYEIIGQGNCNVTFTCLIQAVPTPTVEWIRQDLNATKSSIVSGFDNSTTEIENMPTYYLASFTITNYSKTDVANYACLVYNGVGINISETMLAYTPPGLPTINERSVTFKPGDVIHLNCTSPGGFPAPNISWSVMLEEHANLSEYFTLVDNGVSVAYLDIITDWDSDDVKVWCVVQDTTGITKEMKSRGTSLYLTNKFDVDQDSYPMTNVSFPFRPFYKGPYSGILNLTMEDYRAGLYECKFLSSGGNITNIFHINGTKQIGDSLGARCTNKSVNNCGTLNSICYEPYSRCQCPYEFPIQSEENARASACLPEAPPGTLCLNSRQCSAAELHYECYHYEFSTQLYGFCQCIRPYFRTYIHETGKYQCIAKATYQSACHYDEECHLSDPFLECDDDDQTCECVDGYYYSSSYNYCQYGSDSYLGFSTTAAIIITFAILIVVVFIVTLIFIRTNSTNARRRNRALRGRRAAPPSDDAFQPYTLPDNWSENQTILPPYTTTDISPPPSYHEAQRCETPPPAFDSIVRTKPDGVEEPERSPGTSADSDSQPSSSSGIFHIFESDSATSACFLNPAYEDDC